MWKTQTAPVIKTKDVVSIDSQNDDDWDTDADFINNVSEKEQRWGSKTVSGSGRQGYIDIEKLREEVQKVDNDIKKKEYEKKAFSVGYGGKFGVQHDRVDKSAVGFDYRLDTEKHASQKDYAKGFGGKFGIQEDRKDKSAVGFDHLEKLQKHESQTDYSKGFGGKYGVQQDRKDKSALGFDHVEKLEKHESQIDYSKGFGGKFGIQDDRKDKSALGFEHVESVPKHSSQVDYSKGFGGKFGVQKDRKDKSAFEYNHVENIEKHSSQKDYSNGFGGKFGIEKDKMDKSANKFDTEDLIKVGTNYQPTKPIPKADLKSIKARFENAQIENDKKDTVKESHRRCDEVRLLRMQNDKETSSKETIIQNALVNIPIQNIEKKELEATPQEKVKVEDTNMSNCDENNQYDDWDSNSNTLEISPVYVEPTSYYEDVGSSQSSGLNEFSAVAIYDYESNENDEITFKVNDIINNIKKIDDGWWQGACNGRFGLFPANYVTIMNN